MQKNTLSIFVVLIFITFSISIHNAYALPSSPPDLYETSGIPECTFIHGDINLGIPNLSDCTLIVRSAGENILIQFTGWQHAGVDPVSMNIFPLPQGATSHIAPPSPRFPALDVAEFLWTPTIDQVRDAPYPVTFTVTDENGLTSSNTVKIKIISPGIRFIPLNWKELNLGGTPIQRFCMSCENNFTMTLWNSKVAGPHPINPGDPIQDSVTGMIKDGDKQTLLKNIRMQRGLDGKSMQIYAKTVDDEGVFAKLIFKSNSDGSISQDISNEGSAFNAKLNHVWHISDKKTVSGKITLMTK